MHSLVTSLFGMLGLSTCVWYLTDLWRLLVLEIMLRLHKANKRILIEHVVAAHMRVIYQCSDMEYGVEELSETLIEVISPFVD